MQKRAALGLMMVGVLALGVGCVTKSRAARPMITAEDNPTTAAGRGEPSLDDTFRPAAWVYIDGKAGTFKNGDQGEPLLQWFIEEPVSRSPTFRVEAYPPLLGTEIDFQCAFRAVDDPEGKAVTYALKAKEGAFKAGEEYRLLHPGAGFTLRQAQTDPELTNLDPLPPGQYALLASIKSRSNGKETAAVTYFTVGK